MHRTLFLFVFSLCVASLIAGCGGSSTCDGPDCSCTSHNQCNSRSVCLDSKCIPAYGSRYTFAIRSVVISQHNEDGQAWDYPGGLPDPIVCAYLNDQDPALHCTSAIQDTYTATFNSSFEADIHESDNWVFGVYDEDLPDLEWVGGLAADPIDIGIIKAGGFVANSDYMAELNVDITPVQSPITN